MDPKQDKTSPTPPADAATVEKRSKWDTIFTTTPVLLTVIATILAGLSNSEMIQAQYYRSLAAQSQSKAGDQWNFFQAKRIRGTILEQAVEQLPVLSRAGKLEAGRLQSASARLVKALQRGAKNAERLQKALEETRAEFSGTSGETAAVAIAALVTSAANAAREDEKTSEKFSKELAKKEVEDALSYLGTTKMPEVKPSDFEDRKIEEAVQGVRESRPESQLASLLLQIPSDSVQTAIDTAEADYRAFDEAGKGIGSAIGGLDRLVAQQVVLAGAFHQSVAEVEAALADAPESGKSGTVLRPALFDLSMADTSVKTAAEEMLNLFKAAQNDYTARRYRRETNFHQRTGDLYELRVRKESVASERHRGRSRQFFYLMLCAQAGVAISSISLAAKQKSLFWGLAGTLGLAALVLSIFVYLYM